MPTANPVLDRCVLISFNDSPIFDKNLYKIKGSPGHLRSQLKLWMRRKYKKFFHELNIDGLTKEEARTAITNFRNAMQGFEKRPWPEGWTPKWRNIDGTVSCLVPCIQISCPYL